MTHYKDHSSKKLDKKYKDEKEWYSSEMKNHGWNPKEKIILDMIVI